MFICMVLDYLSLNNTLKRPSVVFKANVFYFFSGYGISAAQGLPELLGF